MIIKEITVTVSALDDMTEGRQLEIKHALDVLWLNSALHDMLKADIPDLRPGEVNISQR